MVTAIEAGPSDLDGLVVLKSARWSDFERMLEMRGSHSVPRVSYFDGLLEILSPSKHHQDLKRCLARLLEAWAYTQSVALVPLGSWTLRDTVRGAGVEPDECYALQRGETAGRLERPDLVIEVGERRIPRFRLYEALEVPELWLVRDGGITAHALHHGHYRVSVQSPTLPGLDLARLAELSSLPTLAAAKRRIAELTCPA